MTRFPSSCWLPTAAAVLLLALVKPQPGLADSFVYDLGSNWSDAANPNGLWTYREGVNPLPHVDAWQGLSGDFSSAQPAWARFDVGNMNLPCVFKSSASMNIVHDWQTGDVVCHTTDDANGVGAGPANIIWTSPVAGTVSVSGAVWMGRDIGRSNHWSLWQNAGLLTEGDISAGDPYDRASPYAFSSGSGGPAAISSLPVNIGDQVMLKLEKTSTYGDYVGIVLSVSLVSPTSVPPANTQSALWLAAVGPNPTRAGAEFKFSLPRNCWVRLDVYDPRGRHVRELTTGLAAAGVHTASWDGRDDLGQAVNSGIYFCRLNAGGRVLAKRVALVR